MMKPFQAYKLTALSTALSPITHMSGTEGNEAVLMREAIVSPDGMRWVPFLTGNALRHRSVREAGARHLISELGLMGTIDKRMLNFLLHGGDRTEKGKQEDIGKQARMYELFPFLKLVAGSLPDQIMKGYLKVWRGQLVCQENRALIGKVLPDGWELPKAMLYPAEHFVGRSQGVRGDVEQSAPEFLPADGKFTGGDNRMIFAGQTVIAGSCFFHGYHLEHAALRDIGCLLYCLNAWQMAGGHIGGQSAKGNGALKMMIHCAPEISFEEAITSYLEHVRANREACKKWLEEAFAKPASEKPVKKSAAKKAAPVITEGGDDPSLFDQE